jgi:membrane protease YdiL (CAAX protease family)
MSLEASPWIASLVVLFVWMVIVLGGEILQAGHLTSLEEMIARINYPLIAAPIFLLTVVAYSGLWQEVGLLPGRISNPAALLVPALAIIAVWLVAFRRGLRRGPTLKMVAANTLLVGLSEELMFRGILFYGAQSSFGSKWAVVITALTFGLVHSLNGAITGKWQQSVEQAFFNILAGFWFGALRVYLNSVIPLILIHWLWDLGLFGSGMQKKVAVRTVSLSAFLPLGCELVLFAYALWLLFA